MDESITSRLNEYLVKVYQRRIIRELYNDPTLPWLPESFWREDFERRVQDNTTKILDLAEHAIMRAKVRRSEDEWLADHASVEELLEEGIEPLLHNGDPRLERSNWGRMLMKHSGGETKPPTPGDPQPQYHFQCYQCGRPITVDGYDHGHRKQCDAFLMPSDYEPWDYHTAKPWHGEEEEDDEDEE